jgi:hypothetical protein
MKRTVTRAPVTPGYSELQMGLRLMQFVEGILR